MARGWAVCEELARRLAAGPPLLLGLAETNQGAAGRPLYNAAALLAGGTVRQVFRKTLLPTYDVFDEDRYFEPAGGPQVLSWAGERLGVSVCEDIWNDRDFWQRRRYHTDPIEELAAAGASCVVNMSASPFTIGKQRQREAMLGAIARKYGVPVVYVNQAGGDDELVFDGRSCAFAAGGELVARAAALRARRARSSISRSWPAGSAARRRRPRRCAARRLRARVRGLARARARHARLRRQVRLSSAPCSACPAASTRRSWPRSPPRRWAPQNVLGVLMPSPYSSPGSVTMRRRWPTASPCAR